MKNAEIFLSYAWGGESEKIVNELDAAFQTKEIMLKRDKRDLGFKGIITDFMDKIGEGNAVVVVISDKYLKSHYCMYELLEIYRNLKFKERIFPIVLGDAAIYEPIPRLRYLKFWQDKKQELDDAIKEFGTDAITVIGDDYKTYKRVFDNFGEVVNILKDINSLTPEMHREDNFKTLIDAVSKKVNEQVSTQANEQITTNNTNVSGSGNFVFQGVSGSNVNISITQNEPKKEMEKELKNRVSIDLDEITDFRKKSNYKRLQMLYKLLDEYESNLVLEKDPKQRMASENEIAKLNEQIVILEEAIKKME